MVVTRSREVAASLQPTPWTLLATPEVQLIVALALSPGDRLSLSRAHPVLREAASQQGWFERETVKVKWTTLVQELETQAAWARRNRAQLSVVVYGDTAGLSLTALHGTRIVTVDMSFCKSPPVDSLNGFSELRELDLTRCGLRVVPPALSGLTALEDLNLWGNEQLGQEGGGLEQLATLTRLRSLKLGCCSLRAVPPALSGLTALEDLNLCCNEQRGSGGSQEQLAAMTRLRSLKLLDCGLRAVPPALSRLTALESLNLSCNERLGQEGGGLERLSALTRLRKLSLSGCGLRAVPPALSSLAALEDLNLNSNELGDGSGLLCLAALARLRRLGLAACGLRAMPPTMSLPTTLEDLDLWGNQQLGVEHVLHANWDPV